MTTPSPATEYGARARAWDWRRALSPTGNFGDAVFRASLFCCALLLLVIVGAMFVEIGSNARLSLGRFGLPFLAGRSWDPIRGEFGALPFIYGIWGLFVLAPLLQSTVQPFLIGTLGEIPVLGALFAGPPYGIGLLTAGLILAVMILPFITSVARDVFETVPPMLRESAYGLGATTWEVVREVVIPYTRVGIIGGVMLGLGRALGETMAVTFVIGNAHRISASILAPGTTISATIANEFTEAVGSLYASSLVALGLTLFVITFTVLAVARLMLLHLERRA